LSARRLAAPLLLAAALAACRTGPPSWAGHPPQQPGWLYAEGRCGEVFVDADARRVALTRAARGLADQLGLDVERRLAVVPSPGDRLFVEALGPEGPQHALDAMQLVDEAKVDGVTYVLVRLAAP
jgi:hypothetical protein